MGMALFSRRAIHRWGSGDTLRRGIAASLVLAILGALGGAWWEDRRDQVHEATALILINPLEGNPFTPDAGGDRLVSLETEAQLVTSDAVAKLVADETGSDQSPGDILGGVSVDVPPNTQLLDIAVEHADASVATARAQAFAETYLAYRRARTEAAVFDRRAQVDEQIAGHSQELKARAEDLEAAAEGSPTALLLQQQISELTTQIGQLRTQHASLQASAFDPGQVVTPAAISDAGLLGTPGLVAALGALLGLSVGLAMTVAMTRWDTRIHHQGDVDGAGFTVLGQLAHPSIEPSADELASHHDLAQIRAAVLGARLGSPFVVLVGSSGAHDALRARTALELARSLGRANLEVALVDVADPGSGGEARPVGEAPSPGVAELLRDRLDPDEVQEQIAPHVQRFTMGAETDRVDDLIATPAMTDLIEDLRKRFDAVVVAGGTLVEPRGRSLLRQADVVALEAFAGQCRVNDLDRAAEVADAAGVPLLGVVLVGAPRGRWRR